MAKILTYVDLDLSTEVGSDKRAIVDIRLLEAFFKDFIPYDFSTTKDILKGLIDSCSNLEEVSNIVQEYVYTTQIATQFHNVYTKPKEKQAVGV